MAAYGNRCCISDCAVKELLEAAHIQPYMGEKNSVTTNGLLLRVDIHRLFDRHLIFVETDTFTLKVHPALTESEYAQFDGRRLRAPLSAEHAPNVSALKAHAKTGNWLVKRSME